ncbi:MAG: NAD(P)/FAD-dependent oxidoreductase [Anaerolineales bacterium]|nr:NAD(P)/FAD-dependent oxidoreductase [Anaerolineales bacterium]
MKIAIIGAGYAGMSAAWELVNAGHEVSVFESSGQPGGLASGFREKQWDWSVEDFYHHWFEGDKDMLGLVHELGLSHKIIFRRPFTVMFYNGKFSPFDSIVQALLFPGLGFGLNKVRFGLVTLYLRLSSNWKTLEKYTVNDWMRKWAGDKAYELMWKPLMDGKFGPYAEKVNMAWLWARLTARSTKLGTYEGGFQQFSDDFYDILKSKGVKILLETPVEKIVPSDKGIGITADGKTVNFDQCLVTTSPGLMSKFIPDLPPEYLEGLLSLKHLGAIVMTLSLKHQLSKEGYYWFNVPKEEGFPFLALVEHTNFLSTDYFGGEHIIYCGDYLPVEHPYFDLDMDEILEIYIQGIQRINPEFSKDWINKTFIRKAKYAQPVPMVDHSKNIPDIRTPLKGLYFASMSQVYPWDRGTNYAVEIGRRTARMMMEDQKTI